MDKSGVYLYVSEKAQVNKRTPVDGRGHKWTEEDTSGRKRTQVDGKGHKWTKEDTSGQKEDTSG